MTSMAFGPPEYVEDYITDPPYTIDESQTIQQARKNMDANNTDYLVVTRNGSPVYILKKYETVGVKPSALIKSIEGKLKPAVTVESGSPWYAVSHRLGESTVLVVVDARREKADVAYAPRILGTISTYKMKWKKRGQYS